MNLAGLETGYRVAWLFVVVVVVGVVIVAYSDTGIATALGRSGRQS